LVELPLYFIASVVEDSILKVSTEADEGDDDDNKEDNEFRWQNEKEWDDDKTLSFKSIGIRGAYTSILIFTALT